MEAIADVQWRDKDGKVLVEFTFNLKPDQMEYADKTYARYAGRVHSWRIGSKVRNWWPIEEVTGVVHGTCVMLGQEIGFAYNFHATCGLQALEELIGVCTGTCECGSGSNLRGPGHSDWCRLYEA